MDKLEYRDDTLYIEDLSAEALANRYGTPCYVYSKAELGAGVKAYKDALGDYPHLIAYAVKANSNLSLLKQLRDQGAGFDVVSMGELKRALATGVDSEKIVFSGVGKREDEIRLALAEQIGCFNVESESELMRINAIAIEMGLKASIAMRVNPDVDPKTHPYISTGLKHNKFGIDRGNAERLYIESRKLEGIAIKGISFHIGSQLMSVQPILEAFSHCLELVTVLENNGIALEHIDIGGGLGVAYLEDEVAPSPCDYLPQICAALKKLPRKLKLVIEPGRSIIAGAGMLLTRVEYIKQGIDKQFVITDAGMNDFSRPSLYGAYHGIKPAKLRAGEMSLCDVVGPVCESSDNIGVDRKLNVDEGDILCVMHAGAYGYSMASNYNERLRPPEILIDEGSAQLIRRRERHEDTLVLEQFEEA